MSTTARSRSRFRNWRVRWRRSALSFRVLALVAAMGAVCGLGELWADSRPLYTPGWHLDDTNSFTVLAGHATRLWAMKPGVSENGGAQATINRLGLRGNIPQVPRPAERERVVLLGDSAFFGHGVGDDQTSAVKLEQALQTAGLDVDVVNCAVPGYSIVQSRLLMEEVCWPLDPTLLIVATMWSDVSLERFRDEDLLRSRQLAQHNPLVRSSLFRWVVSQTARWLPATKPKPVFWDPSEEWSSEQSRRVPLEQYGASTDGLIRQAAKRGVGVLLVLPTNNLLLTGRQAQGSDWEPYREVLMALSAHHQLPIRDLTHAQRAAIVMGTTTVDALLIDNMHPTELGHEMIAEEWKNALLEAGWPRDRLTGKETPAELAHIVDPPRPSDDNAGFVGPQQALFPVERTKKHD